ncbi:MAG: hypothetical protein WC433_08055 [Candidatus Omnitrophota bacterium]
MNTTRIEGSDSVQDMFFKMSEGNPGALTVLMSLYTDGKKIDPDNFMPGLGEILSLDTLGVYGSKIWMLYKDVCGEDLVKMCAVMRANQLGFVNSDLIISAINNYGAGIDIDDLLKQVKARLPEFGKA